MRNMPNYNVWKFTLAINTQSVHGVYGKSTKSAAHLPSWRWMNNKQMRYARLHCNRKPSLQTRMEEMKKFWMNSAGCGCLRSRRSSAHLPQLDFKTQTPLVHSCSISLNYSLSLSTKIKIKAELCVRFKRKKKTSNISVVTSGLSVQNTGKLSF